MRWPWQKAPETRSAGGYESLVLNAWPAYTGLVAAGHGAVATAAALIGRAMALAEVETDSMMVRAALRPGVLQRWATEAVEHGETLAVLRIDDMGAHFATPSHWDVLRASALVREDDWTYRATFFEAQNSMVLNVTGAEAIHLRWRVDAQRPWAGQSPIKVLGASGTLGAGLERQLAEEATNAINGTIISGRSTGVSVSELADDTEAAKDNLVARLRDMHGEIWWMPTALAGQHLPLEKLRLGVEPPIATVDLRAQLVRMIYALCGIPPALWSETAAGTAGQAAMRQFVSLGVEPLAKRLEEQFARVFGERVGLNFATLHASDLGARASSFAKMVQSGMGLQEAAALTGLVAAEAP